MSPMVLVPTPLPFKMLTLCCAHDLSEAVLAFPNLVFMYIWIGKHKFVISLRTEWFFADLRAACMCMM
jgi:cbb3-type cytochrome oxidase subunit 1